jgi:hypothetical protein
MAVSVKLLKNDYNFLGVADLKMKPKPRIKSKEERMSPGMI